LDSSLIIVSGITADPDVNKDEEKYKRRYYNFIDDKLALISLRIED
jgi:hypothetical protein